jgi:hypothetical protein
MGRIDIPQMVEEEFNDWYNTAYIPPYLAVPGCLGARPASTAAYIQSR